MPEQLRSYSFPLGLSLLIHYSLGLTLAILLQEEEQGPVAHIRPKKTAIRMKTVGQESQERDFSVPLPRPSPEFNLENLQLQAATPKAIQQPPLPEEIPVRRGLGRTRHQRRQTLERLGVSPADARTISFTDLDIQFIPPRGVSEDELNSAEKKFYSFQRRVFLSYVSNFVRAYRKLVRERPLLEEVLRRESHSLLGRVSYDTYGRPFDLEIETDRGQKVVEILLNETLENMDRVPNPPDEILEEDGSFTLYYRLEIN